MKRLMLCLAAMVAATIAYADGTINIASPASGAGYSFANNVVTISDSGSYVITGASTTNRVVIAPNVTATIVLQNASITSAVASPFALDSTGCTVTLRIEGKNTLTSTVPNSSTPGFVYAAGLQVEGSARITIEGSGSLIATGGVGGAGIGSAYVEGAEGHVTGNIVITGGVITATGGTYGAGIGGGSFATTGNISITGGNIIATGGSTAAAIGGGYNGAGGNILISGGVVLAIAERGAGIGGGEYAAAGTIRITGGSIFTYSLPNAWGEGAGIGCGESNNASNGGGEGSITISGGTVVASRIGIAQNSTNTPTTISAGVILVDSINATSFGSAQVIRGINVTEALVRAMVGNITPGVADTLHRNIIVTDTLHRDTIVRGNRLRDTITITVDTAYAYDTLQLVTYKHDTIRLDTTLYDTTHVAIALDGDTTYATAEVHDTLRDTFLIVDTTHATVEVFDTTRTSVEAFDTLRSVVEIIDSTLPPETIIVHDTIVKLLEVETQVYVVIDPDALVDNPDSPGTGAWTIVSEEARAITLSNGSVLLEGLVAGAPYAVYSTDGSLLVRALAPMSGTALLRNLSPGTYILWQGGQWWKFVH